jgi:predicted deacylase
VGNIEAEKGSKNHGFLNVGGRAVSPVQVPVMIVNGSEEGPTLGLASAVHGNEFAGTAACMRIYKEVDPKMLNGAVLIAPIVNVPAYENATSLNDFKPSSFVCPIDGIDLMSVDPNGPEGWMSSLIVRAVFKEMIYKSDYFIDIHGVSFPKKGCNTVTVRMTKNKGTDEESERLARLFPCKYIRVFDLEDLPPGAREIGTGFSGYTSLKGIPSIQPEAGHAGEMDEPSINLIVDGILNVMRGVKMMDETPHRVPDQMVIGTEYVVRPRHGGIFFPKIKPESKVSRGEVIGEIKNVFGETVEKLVSPGDGIILWYHFPPPVNSGDIIIKIGEI